MKKLILVLLVSLGSLSTYAQKNGFGIKGGLSSTQVNFEGGSWCQVMPKWVITWVCLPDLGVLVFLFNPKYCSLKRADSLN